MSERRYYLCEFRIDGRRLYAVWYSNADDGLVRSKRGKIASFSDEPQAWEFCRDIGITLLAEPPVVYDFDAIETWCGSPAAGSFRPVAFLNAWNMLDDAHGFKSGAHSLYEIVSQRAGELYEKLFLANNLPAVTPPDAHYEPVWSQDEIELLTRIYRFGLTELRANLHDIDH
jgi:hypothetical protein